MQDADLFMELAGIAGVFVGFGALIAVRSGGASGREEVAGVRGVVSMAALTIVAALAPVTLSRYELTEHQLWMLSAILVLVGLAVMTAAMARTPEYRANWSADIEATRTAQRPRWLVAVEGAAYVLLDADAAWSAARARLATAPRTAQPRSLRRSTPPAASRSHPA